MKNFIRIIIAILISFTVSVGVFAAKADNTNTTRSSKVQSGATSKSQSEAATKAQPNTVVSGKTQTETATETEKIDQLDGTVEKEIKEEATETKKEKIKQEISSYIIDSYKAQGDKILKDIDQTLQKTAPEKNDRIEAYKKIRTSLEARRNKNNISKETSETNKIIVGQFLTHMIDSIDKKISELSK